MPWQVLCRGDFSRQATRSAAALCRSQFIRDRGAPRAGFHPTYLSLNHRAHLRHRLVEVKSDLHPTPVCESELMGEVQR